MRCPNKACGRETSRQVSWADKEGKIFTGCHACIWSFRPEAKNVNVRTGRKIWHAYEAYGKKKTIEKNKQWIAGVEQRAARQRNENACISEGAFNVLIEQTRMGRIRPRENGRPVR